MAFSAIGAEMQTASFSADRAVDLSNFTILEDDVLLLQVTTANAHTVNNDGVFTQIGTTQSNASGDDTSLFYYVATGSEGSSISLTGFFSGAESGACSLAVLRGLDTADLIEATAQGTSPASTTVSGTVTPANDGCVIFHIVSTDPGTISQTVDTSPAATELLDVKDSGNFNYVGIQYFVQTTAAEITLEATLSESLDYNYFTVAFNVAAGGGGGSTIPGGLINGGLVNSGLINSGLI